MERCGAMRKERVVRLIRSRILRIKNVFTNRQDLWREASFAKTTGVSFMILLETIEIVKLI